MTQAQPQLLDFDQFLDWYPETGRYELHRGVVVELQPTGDHEQISGFLALELGIECRRLELPYFVPRSCIVRALEARSGYQPDVIVLDRDGLADEPLWKKRSTIIKGESVKLLIEVASTNWRDDYLTKLQDYEELAVPEYWIVDYLGLAATRYIGSPKQPTISVYSLENGEYQLQQFRGDQAIQSPTFPELQLTANQVFQAMS